MHSDFDAIIVGGGPAGAAAAILLARAGWRVAVIEKAGFPRRKVCGEFISATTWPLLRDLGVGPALLRDAGPAIRRVGVFAGPAQLTAPIAASGENAGLADAGRALGREMLDTVLLERARSVGAEVRQPWALAGYAATRAGHACTLAQGRGGQTAVVSAPILVAAHGSWESGPLPTQANRPQPHASDLLAFKARFAGGSLPADLMPLIAFPGGYGGLVSTGGGRISLSCCLRRDRLEACRRTWPGRPAGAAVLAHILAHCAGAAGALADATLEGAWIAAGPLRPGIRSFGSGGMVAIGNAAAEAHPIIAEGISMAIQSAALLCERLLRHKAPVQSAAALAAIRADYAVAWRRNFARRLHASAFYAHLFMRPIGARAACALLAYCPPLLGLGVRWSGKADPLRGGPAASTPERAGP